MSDSADFSDFAPSTDLPPSFESRDYNVIVKDMVGAAPPGGFQIPFKMFSDWGHYVQPLDFDEFDPVEPLAYAERFPLEPIRPRKLNTNIFSNRFGTFMDETEPHFTYDWTTLSWVRQ